MASKHSHANYREGIKKMKKLWRLTFETTAQAADLLGEALEDHCLAVSSYEVSEENNQWIVEATLDETYSIDENYYRPILDQKSNEKGLTYSSLHIELLPETDWLEQTWKNFPPRQIGPFFIYGSHTNATPPADSIGLEINAATAFGSGEHETTTGCLLTLNDLKEEGKQFFTPLDMGCGSGILAMAATKLWSVPILAVDNDPESVRVTLANAQMNHCEDKIIPLCNEGFEGTIVQEHGPFDLIIANILANPLCIMAPDMVKNLQSGGRIILSGLLRRQREEVLSAYNAAGATFVGEKFLGDWMTLQLTR